MDQSMEFADLAFWLVRSLELRIAVRALWYVSFCVVAGLPSVRDRLCSLLSIARQLHPQINNAGDTVGLPRFVGSLNVVFPDFVIFTGSW